MLENVGIHLQWGKFYYIAHYPLSCTGCSSYIRPYNNHTKSARKCLYSFAMGEILLYSSLSPILDTPLIFLKIVKFKPNTDNLRGIYCYIVFYQQRRIFCYIVVFLGDNILWGIKRSTTAQSAYIIMQNRVRMIQWNTYQLSVIFMSKTVKVNKINRKSERKLQEGSVQRNNYPSPTEINPFWWL